MKRLAAVVLAACALEGALASAASALPGSSIVSQLLLYDNPDGCDQSPCGFYQVWSGRPGGPFAQMLGLGRHESYGDYLPPTVSPTGTQITYAAPDGTLMIAQLNAAIGTASGARVLVSARVCPTPRPRSRGHPAAADWC